MIQVIPAYFSHLIHQMIQQNQLYPILLQKWIKVIFNSILVFAVRRLQNENVQDQEETGQVLLDNEVQAEGSLNEQQEAGMHRAAQERETGGQETEEAKSGYEYRRRI